MAALAVTLTVLRCHLAPNRPRLGARPNGADAAMRSDAPPRLPQPGQTDLGHQQHHAPLRAGPSWWSGARTLPGKLGLGEQVAPRLVCAGPAPPPCLAAAEQRASLRAGTCDCSRLLPCGPAAPTARQYLGGGAGLRSPLPSWRAWRPHGTPARPSGADVRARCFHSRFYFIFFPPTSKRARRILGWLPCRLCRGAARRRRRQGALAMRRCDTRCEPSLPNRARCTALWARGGAGLAVVQTGRCTAPSPATAAGPAWPHAALLPSV